MYSIVENTAAGCGLVELPLISASSQVTSRQVSAAEFVGCNWLSVE